MKRHLWESSLSSSYCPPWPCATCGKGVLRLRAKSLVHEQTAESKRYNGSDEWVPEQIELTFLAWAQCTNETCNEAYAITGLGGVEPEYSGDEDGTTDWVNRFYPKWIVPTVTMIDIPQKCPKVVRKLLDDSFACFWGQPDASAGRIRAALEALLSHVGVPQDESKAGGRTSPLNLHRRIDIYAKESPEIGQQLMAIKWLGNTGSHGTNVTKSDILDALELLEHILTELLEKRSEKMANLAKKLAAKHGPGAASQETPSK